MDTKGCGVTGLISHFGCETVACLCSSAGRGRYLHFLREGVDLYFGLRGDDVTPLLVLNLSSEFCDSQPSTAANVRKLEEKKLKKQPPPFVNYYDKKEVVVVSTI